MRFLLPSRSLLLAGLTALSGLLPCAQAQMQDGSVRKTRMASLQRLSQNVSATSALADRLGSQARKAISLATGKFYLSGKDGLATGYALGDGGVIGIQGRTFGSTAPYSEKTTFVDAGLRPDILVAGDLNHDGSADLVAATRNGSSLAFLAGKGDGTFEPARLVTLPGTILSLATWQGLDGSEQIVTGICGTASCAVEVLAVDGKVTSSINLPDRPQILQSRRLNLTGAEDLITGGSDSLFVLDGTTLLSKSPLLRRLPVSGAVSVATGLFVWDRRAFPQIAVLSNDGSVHTLARLGLDSSFASPVQHGSRGRGLPSIASASPRPLDWTVVESLAHVAALDGATQLLMLAGRVSGSGMDDLVVLNGTAGATTIGHPIAHDVRNEGMRALPARITSETFTDGRGTLAALPLPVLNGARVGVASVEGESSPLIASLSASRTINVNSTSDGAPDTSGCISGGVCRLRDAIALVNLDASDNEIAGTADTVNIPAGTYTLTYSSTGASPDAAGNYQYHMEINGPVNLLGADASTTVLNANHLDKFFSINSGYSVNQSAFDTYISGVTIENGYNRNDEVANGEADGLGGALDDELYTTGNLTLVNDIFSGNTALWGQGGAVYVSDGILGTPAGPGSLEVDGCVFSANSSAGGGGAISTATNFNSGVYGPTYTYGNVPVILSGNTFQNNVSATTVNSAAQFATGGGGAVFFASDIASGLTSSITGNTFSGNVSRDTTGTSQFGTGGALWTGSSVTLANNTFTSNTASDQGGGVYYTDAQYPPQITGNYFSGNIASDGGGILLNDEIGDANSTGDGLQATVQYNHFYANTGARSGLAVNIAGTTDSVARVTATENFWGCNGAAAGSGCDSAALSGSGMLTLSPNLVLTASLTPSAVPIGTQVTLSGDVNTDSSGTTIAAASLSALVGKPITLTTTQGSTTLASYIALTGAYASAGQTVTPTNTLDGNGSVTFDNVTVSKSFTIVTAAPVVNIGFSPAAVTINSTSTLTHTLSNTNAVQLTGAAVINQLPAGLVVAAAPAVVNSCGGAVTAVPGSGSIAFSGGVLPAASSCSISVSVTATTAGNKADTTGAISTSSPALTGFPSNTAVLTVSSTGSQSVTVSAASIGFGASTVALTATRVYTGTSAPTGALTFSVAGGSAVTATCSGSTSPQTCVYQNYPLAGLHAAAYTINAVSAADANYASASASNTLTISQATPVLTLASVSTTYGAASVTLTAQVAYAGTGTGPTGPFTFTVNGGSAVTATCTGATSPLSCQAAYPLTSLAAGSYAINAALATAGDYAAANGTGTLTVGKAATPILTLSNVNSTYGSSASELIAKVAYTGAAAPTGVLQFTINGAVYPAVCSASGTPETCTAVIPATSLDAGTYPITATLAADANYPAATGNGATLTIGKAGAPTVSVSNIATTYGATSVNLIAQITYSGSGKPTGVFTLSVGTGGAVQATCSGSGSPLICTASYSGAAFTGGSYPITGVLAADANWPSAVGTGSLTIGKAATQLTLSIDPAGANVAGQTVTLTAVLTASPAEATIANGEVVAFTVNGVPIGVGQLANGRASLQTSALPAGSDTIAAAYAGDGSLAASTAQTVQQVSSPAGGTLTMWVVPSQTAPNTQYTVLTATGIVNGHTNPTAPILFQVDDGAVIPAGCTMWAATGVCAVTYPTASLAPGNHTVRVSFAGDTNYAASSTTGSLLVTDGASSIALTLPYVSTLAGSSTAALSARVHIPAQLPSTAAQVYFTVDGGAPMVANCALQDANDAVCSANYGVGALSAGYHTVSFVVPADGYYLQSAGGNVMLLK